MWIVDLDNVSYPTYVAAATRGTQSVWCSAHEVSRVFSRAFVKRGTVNRANWRGKHIIRELADRFDGCEERSKHRLGARINPEEGINCLVCI